MWVVTDAPALVDGAHEPLSDTRQVVLNVIVERKTIGDLRASLADGRYGDMHDRCQCEVCTDVSQVQRAEIPLEEERHQSRAVRDRRGRGGRDFQTAARCHSVQHERS